jgi:molybdate transport system regulatory protein
MKRLRHPDRLGLHLRVVLGTEVAMGPGKAELLDGIAATGSIAAAGRRMGMSYKRAWLLVEAMNAMFAEPLVDAAKGGAGGGGAALTPLGARVLTAYRRLEAAAADSGAMALEEMRRALREQPPAGASPGVRALPPGGTS